MASKESQNKKILTHLQKGKTIDPLSALNLFDCFRLSGRIYDLKQEGHNINCEIVYTKKGKKYAEYSLVI